MVKKFFKKRFKRKRDYDYSKNYNKMKWRKRGKSLVKLPLSGFPQSNLVRLRYVDSYCTLDAGLDGTAYKTYRCNSLFDPDQTGLGHQPTGFDQWSIIYKKYCVIGSKITVTYTPNGTNNVNPCYLSCFISNITNPLGTFTTIDDILQSRLMARGYKIVGSAGFGQNYKLTRITQTFSAKKWFGVTNPNSGNALSALMTANPTEQAYFTVFAAAIDGNDPGEISVNVCIDYIAILKEPDLLDGS